MFSKMLVATDLSLASDRLARSLGILKTLGVREVLLVHVLNLRDVGTMADSLTETAEPLLRKQREIVENLGFRVSARVALGVPHMEINRLAEEAGCSLIVIGSHGETMAREILLGGVASAVLHNAVKPVLVIKMHPGTWTGETVCDEVPCNPLEHVLFPTDFSDNAEQAFLAVREIAECGVKRITLFHVQDEEKIGGHLLDRLDEFNKIDMERLERLRSVLEEAGVNDVRIEVLYGAPKKLIIDRIRKGDVSFVVMGSQGRGFLAEFFLGSVSHTVVRHSDIPVLLIPSIR